MCVKTNNTDSIFDEYFNNNPTDEMIIYSVFKRAELSETEIEVFMRTIAKYFSYYISNYEKDK